jgi:parvulin-like peptidyl-prolyl isomerase
MNNISVRFVLLFFVVLMAGTTACVATATHKLPVIDGKETVAMVNGEPITREEYQQEISVLHSKMLEEQENKDQMTAGKKANEKKPGKIDYSGMLKRMIDARLIVQEAKRIGLNDLPEVRQEVENYSQKALRTLVMKQAVKDVKPDEKVVENLYEKAIREWKFESVLFTNEADAKHMETEVRAGGSFDNLVDKAVADSKGKVKKGIEGGYMKGSETIPAIGDALLTMGTGSISPVISVPGGYALVKLEDTRREESPAKRELASQEALRIRKAEVSQQFIAALKKKLAKTDTQLLDSIDLGASVEEFDKFLTDERVITEIGGDEQIKVSDLAGAVQRKYFHGVERAIGKKDLKTQKYDALDGLIERKVLVKEAKLEGLEKTEEYAVLVRTYENSLVFGMFMQMVVLPDIKVMESEVKTYYDGHRSDYTSPEMTNLDSVVFKNRSDAEEAMRKLRAGDQLSWIKANTAGQIQLDKDDPDHLILNGNTVATTMMDEGLKTALSGADAGDFRMYVSPEGYFYVISVVSVYPPAIEDYLSVREPIAKQLYDEHVQAGLADWVEKLRSSATIKVYLKD